MQLFNLLPIRFGWFNTFYYTPTTNKELDNLSILFRVVSVEPMPRNLAFIR